MADGKARRQGIVLVTRLAGMYNNMIVRSPCAVNYLTFYYT